jgi:DNA mismatch repair protein MutS
MLSADEVKTVVDSEAGEPPALESLTPAMKQYWEQKQTVPDALLLFRMGDFYELFYDDAVRAAKLLGIALTSRDSGRTPLAGIPYHALDGYLRKLVAAGVKVAISEQIEDPKTAKGVVKRSIVRVVTPGTLTDDALLDSTRSNVLAALLETGTQAGIAALELSTGAFEVQLVEPRAVLAELARLAPAEILLPLAQTAGRDPRDEALREQLNVAITYRPAPDFSPARADELLRRHFATRSLEGFGFTETDLSLQAAGALLAYVLETQRGASRHLMPPRRRVVSETVAIDAVTLRSLEIEKTLRTGSRAGSLLAAVDQTSTPMGARLLRNWLCYPLLDREAIHKRQEMVGAFRADAPLRRSLRARLRDAGDVERITGRLGVQRITPRDLRAVGDTLALAPQIRAELTRLHLPAADELADRLDGLDALGEELRAQLQPQAPLTLREGGIFADGVHPELDRLRTLQRDGQRWLAEYQARELARTGIPSLKVAFNKVHGFYIEVTNTHRDKVPADYVRRQTVKNAERYVTDELKRYEADALSAETRSYEMEYELFCALRERVAARIPEIQRFAAALAEVDVLAGWGNLAAEREYCRPAFVDGGILEIVGGRHPVVEQLLGREFVPNDTHLQARGTNPAALAAAGLNTEGQTVAPSIALITGPNMAGKSTYIRQVATLTLLAHCGCWVPAEQMWLGPVDRIFTRVGAADELARGQSTFMVEMVETANILHNATPQSLVILDEIGRGTSTFDGLALAWATAEHLATGVGCRTLFATHYHELTELESLLDGVANFNVSVREFEEKIVFLHKIVPGAAGMSYGLHVAQLAGVPAKVLERAHAVLTELEKTFSRESQRPVLAAAQRRRTRQLRLFEAPEEQVVRELRSLGENPTPEEAKAAVERWRKMVMGR